MIRISAIIPTWCEAAGIRAAVERARAIADEVIVADPGSPDGTETIARESGARVVVAPKCRGAQLHAGARAAGGDILLFLHADVELDPSARGAILCALAAPDVEGGNFRISFEPPTPAARLFAYVYDLGRRVFGIYYGDSGLFIRRETYDQLGGFRPLPLFEDYDLIRRLEARKRTAYLSNVIVRASARRFQRSPISTFAIGALLQALWFLGIPADQLVRLYADIR